MSSLLQKYFSFNLTFFGFWVILYIREEIKRRKLVSCMGIDANIKILREHFNITQEELAIIAGVSDKAISTWELGKYTPRMGAIQKIADYFDIKKSNLIEENGMTEVVKLSYNLNHLERFQNLNRKLSDKQQVSLNTVNSSAELLATSLEKNQEEITENAVMQSYRGLNNENKKALRKYLLFLEQDQKAKEGGK